jgi:hypothetical protein
MLVRGITALNQVKSLDKAVRNARVALRPNTLADVGRVSTRAYQEINGMTSRTQVGEPLHKPEPT